VLVPAHNELEAVPRESQVPGGDSDGVVDFRLGVLGPRSDRRESRNAAHVGRAAPKLGL